jgi:hypothetical protein
MEPLLSFLLLMLLLLWFLMPMWMWQWLRSAVLFADVAAVLCWSAHWILSTNYICKKYI